MGLEHSQGIIDITESVADQAPLIGSSFAAAELEERHERTLDLAALGVSLELQGQSLQRTAAQV
ncbi:hypothetical protein [Synechococcus sp. GFB01]|uniref:hypothetical protein n=1 Tax=Synechococcus sp. GFB01 TaxID=1662190 RepID=UPI001F486CE9|nr:hypothetical protein [Synechococcus sp. GFB01]